MSPAGWVEHACPSAAGCLPLCSSQGLSGLVKDFPNPNASQAQKYCTQARGGRWRYPCHNVVYDEGQRRGDDWDEQSRDVRKHLRLEERDDNGYDGRQDHRPEGLEQPAHYVHWLSPPFRQTPPGQSVDARGQYRLLSFLSHDLVQA